MFPGRGSSTPEALPPAVTGDGFLNHPDAVRDRWPHILDNAIFGCFLLFAVTLPHSIKGAERSWKIAFVLWLLKLAIERSRPYRQPLAAPLLAYVTLSAISTMLSPEPYLSWDRMKLVCLALIAILFAENLKRLSQVRILVLLLLASGFAAAGFTAWQYAYGIGVQVKQMRPSMPLAKTNIRIDDVVTKINGHVLHTPADLERIVLRSPDKTEFHVTYLQLYPLRELHATLSREDWIQSGLGTQALVLKRGKPYRAQGTLGSYVVFAEILMQVGCLAWAMSLLTISAKPWFRILLAMIFLAVSAALLATGTRAAMAGLAMGCFIAVMMVAGNRVRLLATSILTALVACSAIWIHLNRQVTWRSYNDQGTQFRLLMWQDGLRVIRQHPWFGIGMGTINQHWQEWNIRAFALYHVNSHFHSDLLQIAVERGLLAMAAWCWFIAAYILFLVRLINQTKQQSRFATSVATGLLSGFIASLITSLVHYNLGEESLVMIMYLYVGLAVAIHNQLGVPGATDIQ